MLQMIWSRHWISGMDAFSSHMITSEYRPKWPCFRDNLYTALWHSQH